MFTDMVGYTALGQKDESLSLAVVEAQQRLLRPVLAKHGGREVKTMGDAFLVEFASAIEAVRCAYDIQRSVREFNLTLSSEKRVHIRVGIHLGEVIEKEGDIYGDAVNVASRIQPLAEDGGVCLTQQVYDHVHDKLEFPLESLGSKSLKNVSAPMEVYRMVMPWNEEKVAPPPQLDKNRIAVLPFASMSPDPNDEYFADGLTEELIGRVSQVSGLEVIARTSVMNYKKKEKNVSQIGRELNVGTVMEGSVRKAGNRIRVAAQLINANTEGHLWSSTYDRDLEDIFAIQSDIANQIAEALKLRLAPGHEQAQRHLENIEAYTLYLKGRFLWNKRNKEGVLGSLKLFQEAVKIDPGYAKAYSGLADGYSVAADWGFMDLDEGMTNSREAATKALELDDTLAEAHASLGVNLYNEYRVEEAQRELRRAIELNRSYATAHHWYYLLLLSLGRMKEAKEEIERAHQLDPLSSYYVLNMGWVSSVNGRLDEAIAIYDKLIENEPTYAASYGNRSSCFMLKGMKEKAYADLEAWHRLDRNEDAYKAYLAILYGWFGERERTLSMIEELIPKVGKPWVDESTIAVCYAVLGDRDEFFSWIDKAVSKKRHRIAIYLRYDPLYDKVRDDPRFPEIIKKLGLPY
jgi:TolB-like protein/Tfp pilus assembly protein PilF